MALSARTSVGSEVRDVAVINVAAWPNLTLPSYVRVNVTVENQGNVSETFNVIVHADNLIVTSATVIEMAPGSNETLKLICDLFPFREVIFPRSLWSFGSQPMIVNVTVLVEASVVAGEVNTTNNVRVGGLVSLIWWFTDLNGDGRTNIIDIAMMAKRLGGGVIWARFDLNGNGMIDMLDLAYVGHEYGKVYYEPSKLDDP